MVVSRPIVKRSVPWATSGGSPIAEMTGDGSSDPLLHAAPADAQIPRSESSSSIASDASRGNPTLLVFHRRCAGRSATHSQ